MAGIANTHRVAPPPGLIAPEQARIGEEPMVRGVFPKTIILTADAPSGRRVHFAAGINQVPHHLARHWYLEAQGVEMDPIPDYTPPPKETVEDKPDSPADGEAKKRRKA